MARRHLDQYFTPRSAVRALLKYQRIEGLILEPCSGQNDIALGLEHPTRQISTNDLDASMPAQTHLDATKDHLWETRYADWVVSNPPFSCCHPIIVGAFRSARRGVAMLLRLSYLEPCNNRAGFLAQNPPSLVVLPRISFTGDGKCDNVTCAWFVWDFNAQERYVHIVPRDELRRIDAGNKCHVPIHIG